MSQQINLKELERKAWRSFYQDGIWDITFGLILLAMAVGAFVDTLGVADALRMAIYIGIELLAVAWMILGRRYITVPRLGQARFKSRRKKRLWVILLLGVSVFAGLVVWFLMSRETGFQLNPRTVPIIWMVNCIVVFGGMAYFMDFDRLYLIGALFALAVPFDQYVLTRVSNANLGYVAFGIPAMIVLAMGLVIFIRFLQNYPPADLGSDHG